MDSHNGVAAVATIGDSHNGVASVAAAGDDNAIMTNENENANGGDANVVSLGDVRGIKQIH
jgi:hypothetical protein